MNQVIRILIVEDLSTDAELIERALTKLEKKIETKVVSTESKFKEELLAFKPDIILLDYALNEGFTGLRAIEIIKDLKLNTPILIVSGAVGEEQAVELFQKGALDFISKQKLERLAPSVHRALNELEEQNKLIETEKELEHSNKALETKLNDLERLNKSMVGRELKMIELKEEIKKLKETQE